MKKILLLVSVLVVLLIAALVLFKVDVAYTVKGRGVVLPAEEWGLFLGSGGSLVHIYENHLSGVVNEYGLSEVQRGDVARYYFNEELLSGGVITKGDTLAKLFTSEIHLTIIELEGQLLYQESLLAAYTTGEKPEDILVAENQLNLAKQELEHQKTLTDRMVLLYQEGVVSQLEYDMAVNELKVKEYALEIADSYLQSLMSGRKSEEVNVIVSTIASLRSQIEQLKKHVDAFHLISPINGLVIRERNPLIIDETGAIMRVVDFSSLIVLLPVDYAEQQYLHCGQLARITASAVPDGIMGEVVAVDKNIRLINNRPKVFLTIRITDESSDAFFRNMMVDASIECGQISLMEYLNRLSKAIYHN